MLEKELKYGCSLFGLDYGIVSEIQNGTYTIIGYHGINDIFKIGDRFPLEGVYCNVVHKSRSLFGTHDVQSPSGRLLHPLYSGVNLRAYLGNPLFVNGELFGTVNFTSVSSRKKPFTPKEIDDMVHLTNRISNILS